METKRETNSRAGSLRVSEGVISKIAALAASEVAGVALDDGGKRLAQEKTVKLSGKAEKFLSPLPVKVNLFKEAAEISIGVVLLQGYKAAAVGENIQKAVKSAVQNMTGIAVSKVSVTISGLRLSENV
ncbi:MAG: Asp23/Gls24 family envelope stress response protein [Oscillospiraceae bacterium]|nr:Asp23/Gls24 family envelope stress response protein [Oscillospiraceae bacterium]